MRRHPWLVVALLGLAGVLALATFPARAYLDQRRLRHTLAAQVAELDAGNAEVEARIAQLGTDREIERLARERYFLVRPGEEAYSILPDGATPPAPEAPAPPPPEPGWWSRAWARVLSLF